MLKPDNYKKFALLFAYFLFLHCVIIAARNDSLNIKNYGAKGDGKTDDYWAFIKAIADINKQGGHCTLIVPRGNYLISVHNTTDEKYKDFEFDSCTDITITGSYAVINIAGNYYRAADYVTGTKRSISRSNTYSIMPFSFINCKNVTLSGFEVNGNSDKVSRDFKVVEAHSHLVRIWESENVTVKNMYLHHGITDGICIGGIKKFSTNIKFYNVIAESNARQGMSIVNARNAIFERCKFINTGYFNGKYGHHNPGAGVDVEPIRHTIDGLKSGNIKFVDCRFENNIGGQIRNGRAISVDSVFFIRDTVIAASSQTKFQLVLGCGYSEMDHCYINIGNGIFYSTSMKATERQSSFISNSVIYIGNGSIISTQAPSRVSVVRFVGNKIYCKKQDDNHSWFDFKYGDVKLLKNEIYFPEPYFTAGQEIYIGNEKLKLNNTIKKLN